MSQLENGLGASSTCCTPYLTAMQCRWIIHLQRMRALMHAMAQLNAYIGRCAVFFSLIEGGDGDKGEGSFLECEGSETLEGTKTKRSNRPRQTSMRAALRRALAAMRFAVGVELLIVAAWSLIGAATCGLSHMVEDSIDTAIVCAHPTFASVVTPTRVGRVLDNP